MTTVTVILVVLLWCLIIAGATAVLLGSVLAAIALHYLVFIAKERGWK